MYVRMLWGRLRRGSWAEYERLYNENAARADQTSMDFEAASSCRAPKTPTKAYL